MDGVQFIIKKWDVSSNIGLTLNRFWSGYLVRKTWGFRPSGAGSWACLAWPSWSWCLDQEMTDNGWKKVKQWSISWRHSARTRTSMWLTLLDTPLGTIKRPPEHWRLNHWNCTLLVSYTNNLKARDLIFMIQWRVSFKCCYFSNHWLLFFLT